MAEKRNGEQFTDLDEQMATALAEWPAAAIEKQRARGAGG